MNDTWEVIECPAWDALINKRSCEQNKLTANNIANYILTYQSVLGVADYDYDRFLGCSLCDKFKLEVDKDQLDKVMLDIHQECIKILTRFERVESVNNDTAKRAQSRYKKWYDKHGKVDKHKRRAKKKEEQKDG